MLRICNCPFQLTGLVNARKISLKYGRKLLKDYLTSVCFLTVNAFGYIGSFCVVRSVLSLNQDWDRYHENLEGLQEYIYHYTYINIYSLHEANFSYPFLHPQIHSTSYQFRVSLLPARVHRQPHGNHCGTARTANIACHLCHQCGQHCGAFVWNSPGITWMYLSRDIGAQRKMSQNLMDMDTTCILLDFFLLISWRSNLGIDLYGGVSFYMKSGFAQVCRRWTEFSNIND